MFRFFWRLGPNGCGGSRYGNDTCWVGFVRKASAENFWQCRAECISFHGLSAARPKFVKTNGSVSSLVHQVSKRCWYVVCRFIKEICSSSQGRGSKYLLSPDRLYPVLPAFLLLAAVVLCWTIACACTCVCAYVVCGQFTTRHLAGTSCFLWVSVQINSACIQSCSSWARVGQHIQRHLLGYFFFLVKNQ